MPWIGFLLGALIGYVAITVLEQVRKRVGVRRDYESLYALGCAFTAYAAAEAVGGSGFVAAFAAGLEWAIDQGIKQGRKVGEYVVERVHTRTGNTNAAVPAGRSAGRTLANLSSH